MSNRENKPTIGALSFALRHKELWPADFHWDYSRCETCAMGLARRMWPKHVEEPNLSSMVAAFGIDHDTAARIFTGSYMYYNRMMIAGYEPILPEHVADVLDSVA
jgi:hypothetical protein